MNKDENLKEKVASFLNISHLTIEEQDKVISGLTENVLSKINIAIIERLSEEEIEELRKISEENNKEKISEYINSKIKDFPNLVNKCIKEEVDRFKEEINKN